jgi:hypothetical protein
MKREKSFTRYEQINQNQFDDEVSQNQQTQSLTLAQLAARGDLDLEKEKNAQQNVMKSFDFEDENMLIDVMNTENYLMNQMNNQPMSNLRPLSRFNQQPNNGDHTLTFNSQLSAFLNEKNRSSIMKKSSFMEVPIRRKQTENEMIENKGFVNKRQMKQISKQAELCSSNKAYMKQVSFQNASENLEKEEKI